MSNIFKVSNEDTRMTPAVFVVSFAHILHYILLTVNIAEFNEKNAGWA